MTALESHWSAAFTVTAACGSACTCTVGASVVEAARQYPGAAAGCTTGGNGVKRILLGVRNDDAGAGGPCKELNEYQRFNEAP
jgi:hypothetical protein